MIGLDELTEHLEVEPDTEDIEMLVVLEKAAVAVVERITGRYFGPRAARTDYLSGNGMRVLRLDEIPIIEVGPPAVTLTVERETSFNVWETVDAADYSVRENELVHRTCWTRGRKNYRVNYTAGYEAGSEPEQIRVAVKRQVARTYRQRGNEDVKSETYGGYSYTGAEFESELMADLAGWIRPVYA